ncbi:MAG: hypothetical protein LBF26_00745 [Puniceicoccales bacterium]|jgi:hypothetical protein|nr:hypothetical protein [Puniceicoccales bacterium]
MPQSNLVKPQRQQSIGAAIRNNPINLVKLLAVVVTWPVTLPVYGPVALCAANFQVTAVTKFSTSFWNVISLNFLRFVEDPPKAESRISEGKKEPQPAAPQPPADSPVIIPELPLIHPPDDSVSEVAIENFCEESAALGEDLDLHAFMIQVRWRALNELEVYELCKRKYPLLSAQIRVFARMHPSSCGLIHELDAILSAKEEHLMDVLPDSIYNAIVICRHIKKYYPGRAQEIIDEQRGILDRQQLEYPSNELKIFNMALEIPDVNPSDMARECFFENGQLNGWAIYVLALVPDAYSAEVWRHAKVMGATIDKLLSEFGCLLRYEGRRSIQRILCGMSQKDLADELRCVSDVRRLWDRVDDNPCLTVKILAALPLDRTLALINSDEINHDSFVDACERMQKIFPKHATTIFPSDAAKIRSLSREDIRIPICILNMPSAREAAELAYEIYGGEVFEKFGFAFGNGNGHCSFTVFTKFASVCRELMASGRATYSNMHNHLFNNTSPYPFRVIQADSTVYTIRALVKYGKISPSTFAQFLRGVPKDQWDGYLRVFDYEYGNEVQKLLSRYES